MAQPLTIPTRLGFGHDPKSALRTQFGALCFRRDGADFEVLLITSRDTGRWIVPKGWAIDGLTPAQAALREAEEEAGVEGRALDACVGFFDYVKRMDDGTELPCLVAVFPVRVRGLRDSYPEAGQRRRKWFSPRKAASKVDEPGLRRILLEFSPPA